MANLAELMASNPSVEALILDAGLSQQEAVERIVAMGFPTSRTAVRRARHKVGIRMRAESDRLHTGPQQRRSEVEVTDGRADVTSDGVTFTNVVLDESLEDEDGATDWAPVFRKFKLNPENFQIVDDTVRISTWQQSKRLENGDRDTIDLWSYSARFTRRSDSAISGSVVQAWRLSLMERLPRTDGLDTGDSGTYLALIADPQLGKKGTEEAVENWKRGVDGHCNAIHELQKSGRAPEGIHIGWQGDETEGVCNNYGNQPHTIELNLTGQLELDYDMRMWTLRRFADFGIPMSGSSVISNHGEWTRNGGKDVVTTRGDNASTHIARQVKKAWDQMVPFGGPTIDWTIGGGEPGVLVNLSGINCYFSHGYIEKGKGGSTEIRTKSALERQILGKTELLGAVPLWFMAHYHHFYMQEFEGRTLFGSPALEAEKSSEYMHDQYGVWSPPGMLGMLIGSHNRRGWSDLAIF